MCTTAGYFLACFVFLIFWGSLKLLQHKTQNLHLLLASLAFLVSHWNRCVSASILKSNMSKVHLTKSCLFLLNGFIILSWFISKNIKIWLMVNEIGQLLLNPLVLWLELNSCVTFSGSTILLCCLLNSLLNNYICCITGLWSVLQIWFSFQTVDGTLGFAVRQMDSFHTSCKHLINLIN